MRRRSSSPLAPAPAPALASAPVSLPEDDDLILEFLLRLPPLPSSLPRASLVCRRWRRLLSDPGFLRRFRAFHHRQAPLLGFFTSASDGPCFMPTLDPPDRIPSARLTLPGDGPCYFLGCRHGLALLLDVTRFDIVVWDPVTGEQRRVAVPPDLDSGGPKCVLNGALLCDDRWVGCHQSPTFKVALLWSYALIAVDPHVFASVYDSQTGVWGDTISILVSVPIDGDSPSVLVGNSFYWLLQGCGYSGILEFDLDRHSLAQIDTPEDIHTLQLQILRMDDNRLGLAVLPHLCIELWERKGSSSGVAKWTLQKTIELDNLLPLRSPMEKSWVVTQGYDEDGHLIFIATPIGVFSIHLKSTQFRNLFESTAITRYHPFTSLYATGRA